MSNSNPTLVVDTIIDHEGTKTDSQIKVYPITIRRYALLEKIDSPFINPEAKFDINGIIPSAFVFITESAKLKEYTTKDADKLITDAFDWSEQLSIKDIPQIIEIVTKQMSDVNKAAPQAQSGSETTEEDGKKKSLQ